MQASSAQELGPLATAHFLSFPNQKIEIEFNGEWFPGSVIGDKPAGMKVKFEEDNTTTVIPFDEKGARVRLPQTAATRAPDSETSNEQVVHGAMSSVQGSKRPCDPDENDANISERSGVQSSKRVKEEATGLVLTSNDGTISKKAAVDRSPKHEREMGKEREINAGQGLDEIGGHESDPRSQDGASPIEIDGREQEGTLEKGEEETQGTSSLKPSLFRVDSQLTEEVVSDGGEDTGGAADFQDDHASIDVCDLIEEEGVKKVADRSDNHHNTTYADGHVDDFNFSPGKLNLLKCHDVAEMGLSGPSRMLLDLGADGKSSPVLDSQDDDRDEECDCTSLTEKDRDEGLSSQTFDSDLTGNLVQISSDLVYGGIPTSSENRPRDEEPITNSTSSFPCAEHSAIVTPSTAYSLSASSVLSTAPLLTSPHSPHQPEPAAGEHTSCEFSEPLTSEEQTTLHSEELSPPVSPRVNTPVSPEAICDPSTLSEGENQKQSAIVIDGTLPTNQDEEDDPFVPLEGSRVEVFGLSKRLELNGHCGVVAGIEQVPSSTGGSIKVRFLVVLEGPRRSTFKVPASKLRRPSLPTPLKDSSSSSSPSSSSSSSSSSSYSTSTTTSSSSSLASPAPPSPVSMSLRRVTRDDLPGRRQQLTVSDGKRSCDILTEVLRIPL